MRRAGLALAAAGLLAGGAGAAAAQTPEQAPGVAAEPVRFFFVTDRHSRHLLVDRFVEAVVRERPAFVIDGGDFVHDGTESEFRRAYAARARAGVPWHLVKGNHDAERRGPFSAPPPDLPEFAAFDHGDVRFVLLDNHLEVLSDAQFQRLEAELAEQAGRRIVVAMHVPPLVEREPFAIRLRHVVPFPLASPVMREPEQVARFTALMERYGVVAVLAGHTHFFDEQVRGGVHYVVGGAAGGLTPGVGIANEYLDVTLDGRRLQVRRVPLNEPPGNPAAFLARAFRFYAELNGFNHAEQGWNYVPSASVQLRGAFRMTQTRSGDHAALWGAASFERNLGVDGGRALFADLGASGGMGELAAHLAGGYKLRPAGDFNEGFYVSGAATGNAGLLGARLTAGLGAQLGLGVEWHGLTGEVSRTWATNHRAALVGMGYRF